MWRNFSTMGEVLFLYNFYTPFCQPRFELIRLPLGRIIRLYDYTDPIHNKDPPLFEFSFINLGFPLFIFENSHIINISNKLLHGKIF